MEHVHGLGAYKDKWAEEVEGARLPNVVKDWQALKEAFKARNLLVHGRDRYTRNMAVEPFEALLAAAADIWSFCGERGVDLAARLPVRRRDRSAAV